MLPKFTLQYKRFRSDDYVDIEPASKRQHIKRGFILVIKNRKGTYESVVQWHVYRTKKDAATSLALNLWFELMELHYNRYTIVAKVHEMIAATDLPKQQVDEVMNQVESLMVIP